MSEMYEKFLEEGGVTGWLGRNVKPMLPQGQITLPAIKDRIVQYLTGPDEKGAQQSAKYFAEALRESGVIVQPAVTQAGQPSYQAKNLDELCARIEQMKKETIGEKNE